MPTSPIVYIRLATFLEILCKSIAKNKLTISEAFILTNQKRSYDQLSAKARELCEPCFRKGMYFKAILVLYKFDQIGTQINSCLNFFEALSLRRQPFHAFCSGKIVCRSSRPGKLRKPAASEFIKIRQAQAANRSFSGRNEKNPAKRQASKTSVSPQPAGQLFELFPGAYR